MYYDMNMDFYDQSMDFYRVESLNNMLVEAMKDERHDRVKYQRMMEMTNDPLVKKQIQFAHDDEIKHYKMFQQIHYQLTGRLTEIPLPANTESYISLIEAVQSSIDGENDAVDLYRRIYAQLSDKQMRNMLFEIITDEQEHFGRFIYAYSILK